MMLRRYAVAAMFFISAFVMAETSPAVEPELEKNGANGIESPAFLSVNNPAATTKETVSAGIENTTSVISRLKSAGSSAAPSSSNMAIGSGVATANPLSVVAGLLMVVALIFVVAWLMRRVGAMPMLTGQSMKVVSALSVGSREKVLLINVGDKQLLIGVAPGRVSKLHYFDEPVALPNRSSSNDFSSTIKKVLQQNKQTANAPIGSDQ